MTVGVRGDSPTCIYIYIIYIYYIYIYIHIRIRELLFEVFFYGWGVPLLVELEIRYWPDFLGKKSSLGHLGANSLVSHP